MKKLVLSVVAGCIFTTAQAQLVSPEAFGGALWGSLIGGIAAGDCRHGFSGEGAAIGAGVGLLAGALAGEARRQAYCEGPVYYYGAPGPVYAQPYVYYAPNAYCAPGYYYQPARPNYAVGGTLLGAASGALIGAGTHRPAEGAAIGAAAGLVVGGVAEGVAQHRERALAGDPPARPPGVPGIQPIRTAVAYVSARQIPDAPRVPNAPTF
jgi:hypothetical protein